MPATATKPKTKSIYGVHPAIAMTQKWIAELKGKTGQSLDEWLSFIRKNGPRDEKARREWLKKEHGLGTNSAWWLAEQADGKGTEVNDPDAYSRPRKVTSRLCSLVQRPAYDQSTTPC